MTDLSQPCKAKIFQSRDKIEFQELLDGFSHFKGEKLLPGDIIVGTDNHYYMFPYVKARSITDVAIEVPISQQYDDPYEYFKDVFDYFAKLEKSVHLWIECSHRSLPKYLQGRREKSLKQICIIASHENPTLTCEFSGSLRSRPIPLYEKNICEIIHNEYLRAVEPVATLLLVKSENFTFLRRVKNLEVERESVLTTEFEIDGVADKITLKPAERLYMLRGLCSEIESFITLDVGKDAKILKISKPDFDLSFKYSFGNFPNRVIEFSIRSEHAKLSARKTLIIGIARCLVVAGLHDYPILWIIDKMDCFKYDNHHWKLETIHGVRESIKKIYRNRKKKAKSKLLLK